jgi:hypothetical protein
MASFANNRGIPHSGSSGMSAVGPDVCWTPVGDHRVPIPYMNVGKTTDTKDGPTTVTVEGHMPMVRGAKFARSTGDEPGSGGGVVSGTTASECEFMTYSFDVKIEGRNVCRLGDALFHNKKNTAG